MAGATTLGDLASAIGARSQEEAAIVAELKAGSEDGVRLADRRISAAGVWAGVPDCE